MRRLALLLALLALAGCGGETKSAGTTADSSPVVTTVAADELIAGGRLQACTSVPTPPFAFRRNGKLTGLEVELLEGAARRLDLAIAWRVVPRAQLEPALLTGRCDVIAGRIVVTDGNQTNKSMLAYLRINHGAGHEHIAIAIRRLRESLWFGLRGAIMTMQEDRSEQRLLARWHIPNSEVLTLP
jgi:ABC-type amino acid transport substrate-binding protein